MLEDSQVVRGPQSVHCAYEIECVCVFGDNTCMCLKVCVHITVCVYTGLSPVLPM